MARDHDERHLLLKGIVVPADWDMQGGVRSIAVLTDNEGEYEVVPGGAGDQLIDYLRREILAEATVLSAAGSVKRVRVDTFAILDWKDAEGPIPPSPA